MVLLPRPSVRWARSMSAVQDTIKRYRHLEGERRNWESQWEEISELVLPRRLGFVGERAKGDRRGLLAVDSTAIVSNELLAAGIHGMLTNPASKWFQLKLSDRRLMEMNAVKIWLEQVENAIYGEFNSSTTGFTSHLHEMYLDLIAFGTAVMFIGTDAKTGAITFSARHLKECRLAENHMGQIDTVYRCFDMTARQLVQKFGEEKVGKAVNEAYKKGKQDENFSVLHAVYPREERKYERKSRDNLPVASQYILLKEEHLIENGGFEEMPYICPRWTKASGETYGRGPGGNLLPDIKMLQEMAKTIIKAAQKVVDPPLQMEDDSVIGPVRTIPGGLNFRRSGADPIQPILTGANIPIGLDMTQDLRNRIREGFFIDQLRLHQGPQMTATEVIQRTEEKLRLLGPVLGRLQSEMLSPLIIRVFGIMARQNKLPPIPEEIAESEYTVEYVSPLARAQRQVEANGLLRVFEIGGPIFEMSPDAAMVFKGGDTIRWLGDLFGVPVSMFRSQEEVDGIMQAQQEAAQAQNQAEMLDTEAGAVQKLSGAMKNAGVQLG